MTYLLTKQTAQQKGIEITPWDVIPIKNAKAAKETTEVHLGGRGATTLVNFSAFSDIEVLWINKNNLNSLKGLESNFRIKHLYAQNNKISNVDGIFERLKHLETLVLYDNELRDLDGLLKKLKGLKNLKHLDLFDNPASHEPNYNKRVLFQLPSLYVLDWHKITEVEREEAVLFITNAKKKVRNDH